MESKYVGKQSLLYVKNILFNLFENKLDIDQGSDNANKNIVVGSDGQIAPSDNPIIPIISADDEGKFLQVQDGSVTFAKIDSSIIYINSDSEEPIETLGEDGDLYLML